VRVILDTNILLSALCARGGVTDAIVHAWLKNAYTLLTCEEQLDELRECFSRPSLVPARIRRHEAGRLINYLSDHGVFIASLPSVSRSPDPNDDFLLALAEAGKADYLVTGDKAGLLPLGKHRGTRIISARDFANTLRL
jgi:putative PIN family toxin of toxin-antitoxin system